MNKIPAGNSDIYKPLISTSDKIKIEVFQGNGTYVKDNCNLAEFKITNIRPPPPGEENKFDITFKLDASSILSVNATCKTYKNEITSNFSVDMTKMGRLSKSGKDKEIQQNNRFFFLKNSNKYKTRLCDEINNTIEQVENKSKDNPSLKLEIENGYKFIQKITPRDYLLTPETLAEGKEIIKKINSPPLMATSLNSSQQTNSQQVKDKPSETDLLPNFNDALAQIKI